MDRATIQRQLARSEERVQHGIKRVERQREIIKHLKRQGLNVSRAAGILGVLNASLRRRQADRDKLLLQLEQVLRRELPNTDPSAAEGAHQVEAPPRYT